MSEFSVLVAKLIGGAEDEWMLNRHGYIHRAPVRGELAALETLVSLHKKMVLVDMHLQSKYGCLIVVMKVQQQNNLGILRTTG